MRMTVMEAYELACREVEKQNVDSGSTAGMFVDGRNQVRRIPNSIPFEHMPREQRPRPETVTPSPGLGGKACLEHREKIHTFADGTTLKACAHTFCGWGRSTKKHSDGTSSGTLYSPDTLDAVDDDETLSPEDPQELGTPVVLVVRGEDTGRTCSGRSGDQ